MSRKRPFSRCFPPAGPSRQRLRLEHRYLILSPPISRKTSRSHPSRPIVHQQYTSLSDFTQYRLNSVPLAYQPYTDSSNLQSPTSQLKIYTLPTPSSVQPQPPNRILSPQPNCPRSFIRFTRSIDGREQVGKRLMRGCPASCSNSAV